MVSLTIEVAYASPEQQVVIPLQVEANTCVRDAIERSGILQTFPEINLETCKVGVFSKSVALSDPVNAGDRIEIYRPLLLDPKERRRNKALTKRGQSRGKS